MRGCKAQRQVRGARGRVLAAVAALLAVLTLALLPTGAWAEGAAGAAASSAQRIDPSATCSITMTKAAEGQKFRAYRVATMDADGKLTAVSALARVAEKYDPAALTASTDAKILSEYAQAYQSAVLTDQAGAFLKPDATAKAGADGTAVLKGLPTGLYLVLSPNYPAADGTTYVSNPYLVGMPSMNDTGAYEYARTVVADKVTTLPSNTKYRVTKLWKGDTAAVRPKSVTVKIYNGKDDQDPDVQTLSADNNWTYEWTGKGDWIVTEELATDSGYTCTVSKPVTKTETDDSGAESTVAIYTITNTRKPNTPGGGGGSHGGGSSSKSSGPISTKTGDTTGYLWPVALVLAGGALMVAGMARRREERQR